LFPGAIHSQSPGNAILQNGASTRPPIGRLAPNNCAASHFTWPLIASSRSGSRIRFRRRNPGRLPARLCRGSGGLPYRKNMQAMPYVGMPAIRRYLPSVAPVGHRGDDGDSGPHCGEGAIESARHFREQRGRRNSDDGNDLSIRCFLHHGGDT